VLSGGWRGPILKHGHRVGAIAQWRSLNLEHQLVDSKASIPPHLPSGSGHWNYLQHANTENLSCSNMFLFDIHISHPVFVSFLFRTSSIQYYYTSVDAWRQCRLQWEARNQTTDPTVGEQPPLFLSHCRWYTALPIG